MTFDIHIILAIHGSRAERLLCSKLMLRDPYLNGAAYPALRLARAVASYDCSEHAHYQVQLGR